jgi:hypothetical protein
MKFTKTLNGILAASLITSSSFGGPFDFVTKPVGKIVTSIRGPDVNIDGINLISKKIVGSVDRFDELLKDYDLEEGLVSGVKVVAKVGTDIEYHHPYEPNLHGYVYETEVDAKGFWELPTVVRGEKGAESWPRYIRAELVDTETGKIIDSSREYQYEHNWDLRNLEGNPFVEQAYAKK